jgi:hypothetical protein
MDGPDMFGSDDLQIARSQAGMNMAWCSSMSTLSSKRVITGTGVAGVNVTSGPPNLPSAISRPLAERLNTAVT